MNTEPPKKQIIEIADYIFANPEKDVRKKILAKYGKIWQKSNRTIDRYYQEAKEYNHTRLVMQEKAKDEVLIANAAEAVKKDILSREEAEEILTTIAKGNSYSDSIRAIQQLSKMEGWDAPIQQEIGINSIQQMSREEILAKIEEIKRKRANV